MSNLDPGISNHPDRALSRQLRIDATPNWRRKTAAIGLAVIAGLGTACGSSNGGGGESGGGGYVPPETTATTQPIPTTETIPPSTVTTLTPEFSGQTWDAATECLMDFVANRITQVITNYADTEYCRYLDTNPSDMPDSSDPSGTFYYYGSDPKNSYYEIIGTKPDGYTYWRYANSAWYRLETGSSTQILQSGEWQDLGTFIGNDPEGITDQAYQLEDTDQDELLRESITTIDANPQPLVIQQEEINLAKTTMNQYDEAYARLEGIYEKAVSTQNNTVTPEDQQGVDTELVTEGELNGQEDRVNTEPDCTFDDRVMDGC